MTIGNSAMRRALSRPAVPHRALVCSSSRFLRRFRISADSALVTPAPYPHRPRPAGSTCATSPRSSQPPPQTAVIAVHCVGWYPACADLPDRVRPCACALPAAWHRASSFPEKKVRTRLGSVQRWRRSRVPVGLRNSLQVRLRTWRAARRATVRSRTARPWEGGIWIRRILG